MQAISLGDVFHATLRNLLGNRCFVKGLLAIAGTKSKVKTVTNTVQYCIDGIMYEKAATDNLFVFTDVTSQPDLTTCFYAFCLDKDGNSVVVNGTPMLTANLSAYPAVLPLIPETACLIGAAKVVTSGAAFVPGTTLLDAGTVTTTLYNLSCVPVAGHP